MKFLTVVALFVVLGSVSLAESKSALYNGGLANAHQEKDRNWGPRPIGSFNPFQPWIDILRQILEALREIQERLQSIFGNETSSPTTTTEDEIESSSSPPTPSFAPPILETSEPNSSGTESEKSHSVKKAKSHGKSKHHAKAHNKSKHHAKEHAKSHSEKKN